jgi:hypothetical protein
MASTLHLDGLPEEAVMLGLVALREKIKRAEKMNIELKRSTDELEDLDGAARDLLDQLGYKEPEKKKRNDVAEVVRDDRQKELALETKPGPRARITCLNEACRCRFVVPVGQTLRKCPDCHTMHAITSDEDGTVFKQRIVIEPPDDIRMLFIAQQSDDLPPLNPTQQKTLDAWIKVNPDHTLTGELVEKGDRVADPDRPGSGNPLEILCDSYIGNGCPGFMTTDTPGQSLCPKCGSKWTVTLEKSEPNDKGAILVVPFDPAAEEPPGAEE